MKKWNWLKVVGMIGAAALIVFGSLENIRRTVKVTFARLNSRD